MNKLMLYLNDKQHDWIRKEAFINRASMNQVVRDLIDARIAVKPYSAPSKKSKKGTRGFEKIVRGGKPVNYTSRGSGKTTDAKLNPKQPYDFSMDRKKK